MIQRIQSVYLLINVISYTILLFVPLAYINSDYVLNAWFLGTAEGSVLAPVYMLGLTALATIILSLATIFLFKNRPLQNKLCVVIFIIAMIFIALLFFGYPELLINKVSNSPIDYTYWNILTVIPLATTMFANKAILKDEKKVRAADRIR
ncbi:MAG: DUF4293 domain-containing protein [Bacteroidales bacterium]|nr:DUF4293 domain-containing protein [Bacteroidales bacterium]MDY0216853.1 DUF4293 domain-containing protein [Bacteroidales bacterium]